MHADNLLQPIGWMSIVLEESIVNLHVIADVEKMVGKMSYYQRVAFYNFTGRGHNDQVALNKARAVNSLAQLQEMLGVPSCQKKVAV